MVKLRRRLMLCRIKATVIIVIVAAVTYTFYEPSPANNKCITATGSSSSASISIGGSSSSSSSCSNSWWISAVTAYTATTTLQHRIVNIRHVALNDINHSNNNDNNSNQSSTAIAITIPSYDQLESRLEPSILHNIYVTDILSPSEAMRCVRYATQYAQQTKCWDQPDTERHVSYSTYDFPVDQCTSLQSYLDSIQFDRKVFNMFHNVYNIPQDQMYYLDLFVVKYQANNDNNNNLMDPITNVMTKSNYSMDRLELHRDGSILSFTITLNQPNLDFIGGGTYFDALKIVEQPNGHSVGNDSMTSSPTTTKSLIVHDTNTNEGDIGVHVNTMDGCIQPQYAGNGVFHCGKLLHGGATVTNGTRIVLVGFVDLLRNYNYHDNINNNQDSAMNGIYFDDNENDDFDNNNIEDESVVRPGVISKACCDWGRLDVATYRYHRQQQQLRLRQRQQRKYMRTESSKKWISKSNPLRNIYPISLQYIERLAAAVKSTSSDNTNTNNHENVIIISSRIQQYQRYRRLQIEDTLLRTILLSKEERRLMNT